MKHKSNPTTEAQKIDLAARIQFFETLARLAKQDNVRISENQTNNLRCPLLAENRIEQFEKWSQTPVKNNFVEKTTVIKLEDSFGNSNKHASSLTHFTTASEAEGKINCNQESVHSQTDKAVTEHPNNRKVPTFVKLAGTTNNGNEYEDLMVAAVTLKLTGDNTVNDFLLSSNDEDYSDVG